MKIVRIEASHISIAYKSPYPIGKKVIPAKNAFVVKLVTDQGIEGYGEGGIFGDSGEGIQRVMKWLDGKGRKLIANGLFSHPVDIESIVNAIPNQVAACAIDHALHDVIGKFLGVPAYRLLGGGGIGEVKQQIAVARSVKGNATGAEMAATVIRLRDEGYTLLTVGVGVGSTPEADIERFAAVRKAAGDELALEVDANGGWKSARIAIDVIRELEKYGLTAAEQPVKKFADMIKITATVDTTVIAHGMAHSPLLALRIMRRKAADAIALTLPRYGGLLRAKGTANMLALTKMGCTLASGHPLGVGTAALGHLAASTPSIQEPIGYGAPQERLVDDILTEPIPFKNGYVSVLHGPGLGVTVDEEK